jgi:hypothetical protein
VAPEFVAPEFERVIMMQWWADYLDTLRAGADVVQLHKASGRVPLASG